MGLDEYVASQRWWQGYSDTADLPIHHPAAGEQAGFEGIISAVMLKVRW